MVVGKKAPLGVKPRKPVKVEVAPNPKTGERKIRPVEAKAVAAKEVERSRIVEYADVAEDVPDLPQTLTEYRELQGVIKKAEERQAELKPLLGLAIEAAGPDVKTVTDGMNQVTWCVVPFDTLSAEKLLEQGVTLEQIQKATVTRFKRYPLVTECKDGER